MEGESIMMGASSTVAVGGVAVAESDVRAGESGRDGTPNDAGLVGVKAMAVVLIPMAVAVMILSD